MSEGISNVLAGIAAFGLLPYPWRSWLYHQAQGEMSVMAIQQMTGASREAIGRYAMGRAGSLEDLRYRVMFGGQEYTDLIGIAVAEAMQGPGER